MIISLVAAVSENGVIGDHGKLPWHLPDDLQHFRSLTEGHPVIMGRKTFESIGRALPNRLNIVVTHQRAWKAPGVIAAHSLEEAIDAAEQSGAAEAYVIGGGEIYRIAMSIVDRISLTRVHAVTEGDATFPQLDPSVWREISRTEHPADVRHPYAFTFLTYTRA